MNALLAANCFAVSAVDAATKCRLGNTRDRLEAPWLDVAAEALEKSRSTPALLPIQELLASDGRLEMLRARDCSVVEPRR